MFDFWFELPPLLRTGMGLVLLIVAAVIFFATGGLIAIGLAVIGLMFILFSKAGDSGGYNF
jgi:hypothetical protein